MASWTLTEPRDLDLDGDIRQLTVSLVAGRLSVVGTDGPPRVEVTRIGRVPIRVDVTGGELRIDHDPARTWPWPLAPLWWWLRGRGRFHVDVSVAVPVSTAATVSVTSGSVLVSQLRADLHARCVSGRITLLGVAGQIRATLVSGPLEALGCAGDIWAETVSGEITLAESTAARVHAKTISGGLTVDLDNSPRDSEITLETLSGQITVRVREDSDLSVELAAGHGRVTSAFAELAVQKTRGMTVRGVLGAGTGRLIAKATGGDIVLLRRPVDADFGLTP